MAYYIIDIAYATCHAIVQSILFVIAMYHVDDIFIHRVVIFVKTFIRTFADKLIYHISQTNAASPLVVNLIYPVNVSFYEH